MGLILERKNNSLYVANRSYPYGYDASATSSSDLVSLLDNNSGEYIFINVNYADLKGVTGSAFATSAADAVSKINTYLGTTNPDGNVFTTDKITALADVEQFTVSDGNKVLLASPTADGGVITKPLQSLLADDTQATSIVFDLTEPDVLIDGRLAYDTDRETLVFQSVNGELALGEIYKPVINNTTSNIPAGYVVKASGVSGERFEIQKFKADSNGDEELYLIGVTQKQINANGGEGLVVTQGVVKHLNTSGWTVGTILYANPAVQGGLISSAPNSPNLAIPVAMVTKQDATNGTIFVRPTIYNHLGEIHDVFISSPSNGQLLTYNSASGVWQNADAPVSGISNIVEDTTPQLGGDLDVNGSKIVSSSNGDIIIEPDGTGDIILSAGEIVLSDNTQNMKIQVNSTSIDFNSDLIGDVLRLSSSTNRVDVFQPLSLGGHNTQSNEKLGVKVFDTQKGIVCENSSNVEKFKFEVNGSGQGVTTISDYLNISGQLTIDDGVNPFTLPVSDGTSGQVLQTNGLGVASWEYVSVSVNGEPADITGDISVDTSLIPEATNLYYTDARVESVISAKISDGTLVTNINGEYSDGTGEVSLSTAEIPESQDGLYYTDTRVQTYLTSQKISASYPTSTLNGNTALTSTHEQKMLICDNGSGMTLQINTGMSRDAEILVYQAGAGAVTISAGSGVTINNTSPFLNITAEQYAIIGLKKLGTSEVWVITGERKLA